MEYASNTAKREAALAEYKKGGMTTREVAAKYGMSQSAVFRLVSGGSSPSSKRGRQTTLPPEIEEQLVDAAIRCSNAHVGMSPLDLRRAVGYYVHRAGLEVEDYVMSEGWYASFMNRNRHRLSSLQSRSISKARSMGFNRVTVDDWFNFVEPIAARFSPSETFNCDDTGFNLEVDTGRVVGEYARGQPQVRVDQTKGGHIGATLCGPARGPCMPVLWTFPGVTMVENLAVGAGLGDCFIMTEKGWATPGTYFRWAQMFVAHLKKHGIKKALLYADNADIHINEETCKLFLENGVTCVGLMPGATHKHQPWDVCGIQNVKEKMRGWAKCNKVPYTKVNVMRIFAACFSEVVASRAKEGKSMLQAGFLKTGLVPFNKAVFFDIDFRASDVYFGLDDPKVRAGALDVTSKRWVACRDMQLHKMVAEFNPRAADALGAGAKIAQAKRLAKMLAKLPGAKDAEGRLDLVEAAADRVWTSEAFFEHKAANRASKAAEEAARKQRAAAAAAAALAKAAAAAERSAQRTAERAAAAKAREEVAAAKAAARAAKAVAKAKPPAAQAQNAPKMPQVPLNPRKRAREAAPAEEPYTPRQYNKRARQQ